MKGSLQLADFLAENPDCITIGHPCFRWKNTLNSSEGSKNMVTYRVTFEISSRKPSIYLYNQFPNRFIRIRFPQSLRNGSIYSSNDRRFRGAAYFHDQQTPVYGSNGDDSIVVHLPYYFAEGTTVNVEITFPYRPLISPESAPFDHLVVLMLENQSFDSLCSWMSEINPEINSSEIFGLPKGITQNISKSQRLLSPKEFQESKELPKISESVIIPDNSWEGQRIHLNNGKMDGFDKTIRNSGPVGNPLLNESGQSPRSTLRFQKEDCPIFSKLAQEYTLCQNYFSSFLGQALPNRFYALSGQTDRTYDFVPSYPDNLSIGPIGPRNITLVRSDIPRTIFDRLSEQNCTGKYYGLDLSALDLYTTIDKDGQLVFRYSEILSPIDQFFTDLDEETLPNVSYIDPRSLKDDDSLPVDHQVREKFIEQVVSQIQKSKYWKKTIIVVMIDQSGGFVDSVVPPIVADETSSVPKFTTSNSFFFPEKSLNYGQLGFRVPTLLISPFSPRKVFSGGPLEHCSILKMIEWRWGLKSMTSRDTHAQNLAVAFDFSLDRE